MGTHPLFSDIIDDDIPGFVVLRFDLLFVVFTILFSMSCKILRILDDGNHESEIPVPRGIRISKISKFINHNDR